MAAGKGKAKGKKKTVGKKKSVVAKKAAPMKNAAAAKKAASVKKPVVAGKSKSMPSATALANALRPLADRLLIFVEAAPEKTAGGLYIPTTSAGERPTKGKVIAKGTGLRNKKGQVRPLDVAVGDAVLFPDYAGTKLVLEGTELLMIHEAEVLGIAE